MNCKKTAQPLKNMRVRTRAGPVNTVRLGVLVQQGSKRHLDLDVGVVVGEQREADVVGG